MRCEKCGSFLVVDRGAYVCPVCGTVHSTVFDFEVNDARLSEARLDSAVQGSVVASPRQLRMLQVRVSYGAREQAVLRARRLLSLLKPVLGLSERECSVVLGDFLRYAVIAARRGLRVRRAALLLALAYLESREKLSKVNLRALVRELRGRGVRVRVGDVLRALDFLRREGAVAESWEELLRVYAGFYAQASGLSAERVLERALELLSRTRQHLTGRSRRNVAAAVVYVAGELEGARVPLARYARATGVPVSSLKTNVDLVRSLFLEELE